MTPKYDILRTYDSLTGRYLEVDPIARWFAAEHPYIYDRNDPTFTIDLLGLHWEFSQSSGKFTHVDDNTGKSTDEGVGYSGIGEGLNNPAMESVPNVGPLPQGTYKIGPPEDYKTSHGSTLKYALPLSRVGKDPYGRGGFFIHGDKKKHNHTASNGCPVVGPAVRHKIAACGGNVLKVVR